MNGPHRESLSLAGAQAKFGWTTLFLHMANPSRQRAHVLIDGKVQGVYYRANTKETAEQLGVAGWVLNRDDGRVEAVFEGTPEAVDEMIDWCYEGSPAASVTRVDVEFEEPEGETGFQIRR